MKTIPLTQGKVALVDDSDYEYLNQSKWCALKVTRKRRALFYAITRVKQSSVLMHCLILGKKGIDHRDGNGLNNQRSNLRPASVAENCRNRMLQSNETGFKGVYRNNGRFSARIQMNDKSFYLGSFNSPKVAALAYDNAAEKLFGEFARTNQSMGLLPRG